MITSGVGEERHQNPTRSHIAELVIANSPLERAYVFPMDARILTRLVIRGASTPSRY